VNTLGLALRSLWRDIRSGDLLVLLGALAVAVAAMTAVGAFTERVGKVVVNRASEVLAADLVLRSNRPIPDAYDTAAREAGLETARAASFPTVVVAGDASALAEVEAVSRGYPLRGHLEGAESLEAPVRRLTGVPARGEAWADPRLLARLGIGPGDRLQVGEANLAIARTIESRPDQAWDFADFAPTLLINFDDVPATELVQPGSRVGYRLMLAGEAGAVRAFRAGTEPGLGVSESFRDLSDARPEIRSSVDRAQRFLGLAALVAALLSAIAVAVAANQQARQQQDTVALMKCFGASRGTIVRIVMCKLLGLGLASALVGVAVGYLAQAGLSGLAEGLLGTSLPPPGPVPGIASAVAGMVLLAGFAAAPQLALAGVPPIRVLHQDLPPATPARWIWIGLSAAAFVGLLWWQIRDPRLLGLVLAGLGGTLAALGVAGWLLVRGAARLRGAGGTAWRYGLASLGRRGRDSAIQLAAFGLGLMVLLLLTVVRGDLMDQWQASLPASAPNRFVINIQPEEAEAVAERLGERLAEPGLVPLVRARLTQINGRAVDDLQLADPRARRMVDREANLSWNAELQADNEIVAGSWWSEAGGPEVSVEQDFARDIGIELGDSLRFDVAGEVLEARVTSLRSVRWDSFRPNFFMVFAPGVLDDYPKTYIGSFFVEPGARGAVLDLIRSHPSVTVIDIEALLGQVRSVMDQAATAVQYVFLFTLLAGLAVMFAVIQATREERRYESAMLRTLGAPRRTVLAGIAVEFSVLGLLAGLLGAAGAAWVGSVMADRLFDLPYAGGAGLWTAGLVGGTLLIGLAGVLATRRAVARAPMEILRRY
jgi:putative ABC transport system permease protein